MAGFEQIDEVLRRAGRRRRWQRAWRGFWFGLLLGGAGWLVVLGLYKAFPLPVASLGWGGVLGVLAPLIGFAAGWMRAESPLATARWLDLRQGFQERLSTAVELNHRQDNSSWGQLVVADAARRLDVVNLRALLPHHLPRTARYTVLVLALGAGLGFVPEYRSATHLQQERERQAAREAGQRLVELTRRTLEKRQPVLEATEKSLEAVEELGKQMVRRPLGKEEALRDLAKLTEHVEDQLREMGQKPALRAMERSARSSDANTPASAQDLEQQIEALQRQMNGKTPDAGGLEKLADALRKAQRAASQMGAGSEGQDAAQADLADSLADMARMAADLGASLPGLEAALEALKAGQIDQMLKNLDVASEDLQQLLNMAQAMKQMQQQAAQLGKNLKEQLERGQAAPASSRLRQMAKELMSGQTSPEKMQQMMKELSEALVPAGQYGKVQDLLKQGLQQMQAGQAGQAAGSMNAAAKELEDLMQQLADAQDLQSTLDALKRAQMCVGNGNCWGQCQGLGQKAGTKPGGKPGRGVGTWGDDSLTMTPQDTGLWDNSGIERPDLDPRGLTDRGEGNPPEGLLPTRVKGQFNPGGPMPSITLKGVSIKGQSRVALQEAVSAAQTEAQSALSQDEIPRAYQGAVRNYFDDL